MRRWARRVRRSSSAACAACRPLVCHRLLVRRSRWLVLRLCCSRGLLLSITLLCTLVPLCCLLWAAGCLRMGFCDRGACPWAGRCFRGLLLLCTAAAGCCGSLFSLPLSCCSRRLVPGRLGVAVACAGTRRSSSAAVRFGCSAAARAAAAAAGLDGIWAQQHAQHARLPAARGTQRSNKQLQLRPACRRLCRLQRGSHLLQLLALPGVAAPVLQLAAAPTCGIGVPAEGGQ